jgi:hypothetical protein
VHRILEQGEHGEYWRRHEARAPALASTRRLLRMRRPAETPLFGRKAESATLDRQLAAARAGRGAVVQVIGPEGIGRRRLLDEAMQRWLDGSEPPLCLGGEADSGLGHGEPFASSLLDVLLRGDDRDSPNSSARAAEGARTLLGLGDADADALAAVTAGTSTEPSEVRADRLATALLQLPRRGRVLVLRVDHAERLDTSGRLVLQRLLADLPQRHLLLLLAVAPETTLVGNAPGGARLDLLGLDEAEFLAFGRALFRDGEVEHAFLLRAHQILSGLPGNLIEALDHLAAEGRLRGRAGDYHDIEAGAEARPAPGHLERFHRRVAGLEVVQRRMLSAAAVLGERCALADLAALVQSPELAVLETLSLFRGRIVRAQGGEVSFRHPDFQKALLRTLPADERQALHLAAARLLEQRSGNRLEIGMQRSMALDHEGCLDPLLDGLDARVRAGSRRTAWSAASPRTSATCRRPPPTNIAACAGCCWPAARAPTPANPTRATARSATPKRSRANSATSRPRRRHAPASPPATSPAGGCGLRSRCSSRCTATWPRRPAPAPTHSRRRPTACTAASCSTRARPAKVCANCTARCAACRPAKRTCAATC